MSQSRAEKAHTASVQFASFAETVRGSRLLSDDEKRRQLARGWVATTEAVKKLTDEVLGERKQEREALMRRITRPAAPLTASDRIATTASYRDALLRADEATKEELVDLLWAAETAGDYLQVKAVIATAVQRGRRRHRQRLRREPS